MATLVIDKTGKTAGFSIQWYENKERKTIYLGGKRYNKRTAERMKEIVETLIFYRYNGISVPDKNVLGWLEAAPDELRAKLSKSGLIAVTKQRTCAELWDEFLRHRIDLTDRSAGSYENCRKKFFAVFSPKEAIEKVTPQRILEWRLSLVDQYEPSTIASYLKKVAAIFNWAMSQDWIAKNPMRGIPRGNCINREKDRIITREEYAKLLDACPNKEWRVIIALARYGGLRCPSELIPLRWSDVNWAQNRFFVRSPKTKRHTGHGEGDAGSLPDDDG